MYKIINVNQKIDMSNSAENEISMDVSEGFSFISNYIIYKKEGQLNIFSNRCTHLNCIINKSKDHELLCPCHGSRFSGDGTIVSGPAIKNLKKLSYRIDNIKNVIIIENEI
ncbi:MAG: Rieske 2Fe-2S domain-containing protein [bacterium]